MQFQRNANISGSRICPRSSLLMPTSMGTYRHAWRYPVPFAVKIHHQNITPNPSRLGVFVCGFPKPRGGPGYFACASRSACGRHDRPGSPLLRPIFSRNLRQLLRRGTRTSPCAPVTYARVAAIVGLVWDLGAGLKGLAAVRATSGHRRGFHAKSAWKPRPRGDGREVAASTTAGTVMPRRSKVAPIAWASRSVSRVSRSSSTDRSK